MINTRHSERRPGRTIQSLDPQQQATLWLFLDRFMTGRAEPDKWYRDKCMILLMLDAGLRVAEVAGLQRINLWFREGPVIDLTIPATIAKNGIERIIPLSSRLREAIVLLRNNYWGDATATNDIPAFEGSKTLDPITTRQIQRIVKQLCDCCLGIHVTPHMLRHTFATRMMRRTSIRVVQQLLGHASLSSTQVYTHPDIQDLRKAVNGDNA